MPHLDATLSTGNQITLPSEVQDFLHLSVGDEVEFSLEPNGQVMMQAKANGSNISELKGFLKGRLNRVLTVEDMEEAIAEEAASRFLEMNKD